MSNEFIRFIKFDGFDMGPLFDENPGNDLFDNAGIGDDTGRGVLTVVTGTIPIGSLATIVEDGQALVEIETCCAGGEIDFSDQLDVNLSYNVPEPSTALLLASGLAAMAVGRRRTVL